MRLAKIVALLLVTSAYSILFTLLAVGNVKRVRIRPSSEQHLRTAFLRERNNASLPFSNSVSVLAPTKAAVAASIKVPGPAQTKMLVPEFIKGPITSNKAVSGHFTLKPNQQDGYLARVRADESRVPAGAHGGMSRARTVLIGVVAGPNPKTKKRMLDSIKYLGHGSADWAVLLYGENNTVGEWGSMKNEAEKLLGVRVSILMGHVPRADANQSFHPKLMFQQQLAPLSFAYDYVWLLDEDISLVGFQFSEFWQFHQSFPHGPPMIAQPLIAGNTQISKYMVNAEQWEGHSYMAAEVTLVEQQAPLLSSEFFRFFVNRSREIIIKQRQMRSSWGHDEVWCGAAFLYLRDTLKKPRRTACAIIMRPVTHDNAHTTRKDSHYINRGTKLVSWIKSPHAPSVVRAFSEANHMLMQVVWCHSSGGIIDDSGTCANRTSKFSCWGHLNAQRQTDRPAFSCRLLVANRVTNTQTFGYLVIPPFS